MKAVFCLVLFLCLGGCKDRDAVSARLGPLSPGDLQTDATRPVLEYSRVRGPQGLSSYSVSVNSDGSAKVTVGSMPTQSLEANVVDVTNLVRDLNAIGFFELNTNRIARMIERVYGAVFEAADADTIRTVVRLKSRDIVVAGQAIPQMAATFSKVTELQVLARGVAIIEAHIQGPVRMVAKLEPVGLPQDREGMHVQEREGLILDNTPSEMTR